MIKHPQFVTNPSFRTGHFETARMFGTLVDAAAHYWGVMKVQYVEGSSCEDPENCALARALRDDPNVLDARVITSVAFVIFRHDPLTVVRYELEDVLANAVRAFDKPGRGESGEYFPLGEFKLSAPTKYKLGSGSAAMWGFIRNGGKGIGQRYPSRGE